VDIDDTSCSFGTLEWDVECDNVPDKVSNIDVGSNVIQTGDTTKVMARVVDSCGHGVEGQTVSFYEVFTPSLTVSTDSQVVQSGSTIGVSAKLKDTSDGSAIKGQTVYFYVDE